MAKEKICGIYCIENLVNSKKYIGQSVNIHNRWNVHKAELRHNRHDNPHLQNAWNKYGENNFNFFILEQCDYTELDDKEIFYIRYYDTYNSGYNLTIGGQGTSRKVFTDEERKAISERLKGHAVSEETRIKMRENMLAQFNDDYFLQRYNNMMDNKKVKIKCYDKNGFLLAYDDIHSAARQLGVEATNICKVLKGKHKTAGIYTFCYEHECLSDEELKDRYVKNTNIDFIQRRIEQIDKNNEIVKVFDSIAECSSFYDIDNSSISKVCRGKLKTTHGMRFRYAS